MPHARLWRHLALVTWLLALYSPTMSKTVAWFVYALTAAFFACFFVWPISATLGGAFFDADGKFTLEFVAAVFRNRIYLEGLANSLSLAVGSTVLALGIALPLAFIAD